MARDLSESFQDDLNESVIRPFYACHVTLPNTNGSGTVTHKMWTGDYDFTYYHDGATHTYAGAGSLLGVSDVTENADLQASGLEIKLIASAEFITVLRDLEYQGGAVIGWLGIVDINSLGNKANPAGIFKFFEGFVDTMHFTMSENACLITLKAENKLIRLSKSNNRRYTAADQKIEYPSDKGFEFVNTIQDKEVLWGRT
jgi:hypothetical protein|tara:strand:+ start:28 stop:627 length:600 start_codon:yes stop_codon:yes gene_type:complete